MDEAKKEQIVQETKKAVAMMKTITGVSNNASIPIMLDAYSEISGNAYDHHGNLKSPHPEFKHRVKQLYKRALKKAKEYENNLLYARENKLFHVAAMSEETRRQYSASMTDEQYFELWKGTGAHAYTKTRPLVTCLQNKYKVSLSNHNIPNADQMAWVLTASACLKISVQMADNCYKNIIEAGIPKSIAESIHSMFTIKPVFDAWCDAMEATQPDSEYQLSSTEQRNIEMTVVQLLQEWKKPSMIFESWIHAVSGFDDIFRTQGSMKKALDTLNISKEEAEKLFKNG